MRNLTTIGRLCLVLAALAASVHGQPPPAPAGTDIPGRIAAAGDAAKHDADLVIVLEATDVRVRPNGIGTARTHRVTKILRDAGAREQAVQRFPFDPHTNRLDLINVRVYRKDGTVVEVALENKRQQPQPEHGVFWGTQQYLLSLPRLEVGDAVETISDMTGFNVAYLADEERSPTLRGSDPEHGAGGGAEGGGTPDELNAYGQPLQPPVPGHWHDEVHFWSGVPIIEKRYSVRLPKDKPLQYEVYNGTLQTSLVADGDELLYTFTARDITPLKNEPNMEPTPNVAPKLLLATLPSWEDKSRWLYAVSEPQFASDDAIHAKVQEIIAGCRTDEEKYTALNHWVAENIRYAGTSRGMCEGYTIHKSVETFHDRAGVCKDKAGMLVTMLRCAGFDSFLVMTMARQRVDRIPADQFNHAVTCLRQPDGELLLLDPTWMPKSRDNWSTLEPLQHVVYGIPEGKELSQSPYFAPETCRVSWTGRTRIDTAGGLTGDVKLTACGAPEGRLRRALAATPLDGREAFFAEGFQRISPNVALQEPRYTDPVDFARPFELTASYAVDGFALGDNARRYLALPLLQAPLANRMLSDLFGNTGPEKRKYGLKLWATRLAQFEETVELPPGWTVAKLPDAVDLDGPAASLHFSIEDLSDQSRDQSRDASASGSDQNRDREGAARQLRYTCTLTIKTWLVPLEDYANFKEVMEKFDALCSRVVVCEEVAHAAQ